MENIIGNNEMVKDPVGNADTAFNKDVKKCQS